MCLVYGLNSQNREHLLKTASGSVTIKIIAMAISTPCKPSEMNPFIRTVNRLQISTCQTRCLWQGPGLTYSKKPLVKRGEYWSSKLKIWSVNFLVSWLKCFISSLLPLSWILMKTFSPYAYVESISIFCLSSQ